MYQGECGVSWNAREVVQSVFSKCGAQNDERHSIVVVLFLTEV